MNWQIFFSSVENISASLRTKIKSWSVRVQCATQCRMKHKNEQIKNIHTKKRNTQHPQEISPLPDSMYYIATWYSKNDHQKTYF